MGWGGGGDFEVPNLDLGGSSTGCFFHLCCKNKDLVTYFRFFMTGLILDL